MQLSGYLAEYGIRLSGVVPLSECTVHKPYLLSRAGFDPAATDGLFVCVMAVPYLSPEADADGANLSAYAVPRDYHLFFRDLFDHLLPRLRADYPGQLFAGFADHSPILEVEAAAAAGLGLIGMNRLLLTRRHSSFVFLGEIITDLALTPTPSPLPADARTCHRCGNCTRACPALRDGCDCYSGLTQKKHPTERELSLLRAHGTVWGCDVCQRVCPYTNAARKSGTLYTDIPFFRSDLLPSLTGAALDAMDDAAFAKRAYSWHGRDVIRRNLALKEQNPSNIPPEGGDTE